MPSGSVELFVTFVGRELGMRLNCLGFLDCFRDMKLIVFLTLFTLKWRGQLNLNGNNTIVIV